MGYVWEKAVMSHETHIINVVGMGEGCNESQNTFH